MGPNEMGPQGGDSIDICISLSVKQYNTTNTVGVNEPNIEPVADTDEACKTFESYNSASTADENGELEPNLEIDGEDRGVEMSDSSYINGDDQDTVCNGENSEDSRAYGYESAYSAEPEPVIEASDVIKNRSDMELDYDMDDPIEFARQVAIEVEREVEDCEEESSNSSSSDKALESVSQLNEPESGARVQPEPESENLADKPANAIQETESSQFANVNQALSDDNAEKSVCDFDLNEEVCVEKIDDLENQISTPFVVCSASINATVIAVTPLEFEGNHGWKGSAATSAFHSVSGTTNNSSKQRDDCLDFDLNIHESSVEPDVEATERLNLDLNCSTFEEQQIQHSSNVYHNLSSSKIIKSIDLNDQPSLVSEHDGTSIANDLVISIMGVKVDVNKSKSNSNNLNSYLFSNGWDPMPPVDVNLGLFDTESAVPYVYTDLTTSAIGGGSISIPMYGQYGQFGAHMFDSPQAQPGFHYPHLMTGMGSMPESNEVGSSDLSLNLNTDGNRENGVIRQHLYTPQTTNLVAGMMKRREPESGWERELFPLKRHQST